MFAWYRDAKICYTFLVDVSTSSFAELNAKGSAFRSSVWFTRGWTLQELIAPRQLVFLSQTWEPLGTKASLSALIEEITGIPTSVLVRDSQGSPHRSLDKCSVAQRMSWAANRNTTKVEDEAYSLLGIFDIHMPLLYGEGSRAFRRLQEEILRRIPDQTIFAWGNAHRACFSPSTIDQPELANSPSPSPISEVLRSRPNDTAIPKDSDLSTRSFNALTLSGGYRPRTMFAESPGDFARAGRVIPVPLNVFRSFLADFCDISPQEYTSTPYGIRTDFPLLPLFHLGCPISIQDGYQSTDAYLAVLACQQSEFPGQLLCCVCHLPRPTPSRNTFVSTLRRGYLTDGSLLRLRLVNTERYTLFRLSLPSSGGQGQGHGKPELNLRLHTVYLDHPKRAPPPLNLEYHPGTEVLEAVAFTLPTWCIGALRTRGYDASLKRPGEVDRAGVTAYRLTVSPQVPRLVPRTREVGDIPFQWNIVVDFGCECGANENVIHAAVHVVGWDEVLNKATSSRAPIMDLVKAATLEWVHQKDGHSAPSMVKSVELARRGPKRVSLVLGVEAASASGYRIHVEFVDRDSRSTR
ncbi:hypothetical protein GSI_13286 [Ganoderma sinense ZZ0214-1]|uniref:DUF8212 domain-containing protein n=1 Tax=Ganoderma sinense ZZ0214-1 TaxID=1077348 RepID=A0A2G8RV51_9APHY|nr:hypothetical protein GSI_13286 [Ganoderma sinense ZZ0214-1]